MFARNGICQERFNITRDRAHAIGRQRIEEVTARASHRVFHCEEAVVETHFHRFAISRADPVDGALDLAAIGRITTLAIRIIGAVDFGHFASLILHDMGAREETQAAQTHFVAHRHAEELLDRHFHEVIAVNPEFTRGV